MCLGIPAQITGIVDAENMVGRAEVAGVSRAVNLALVVDEAGGLAALEGCWVLVHVGFAMALLDAGEARRTLALIDALGQMSE
jgi:hydrogenase expression/formation protein HypC